MKDAVKAFWRGFKQGFKEFVSMWNWPLIFVVLIVAVMYHAGKMDGRDEVKTAAIYHGCALAKITVPDYGEPKIDLDTFRWNVTPELTK